MIRRTLFTAVAMLAGSALVAQAAPKDDVSDAAKKLSGAGNYTWTSNTQNAGGRGGAGGGAGGAGADAGGAGGGGGGARAGRGGQGGPIEGKVEKEFIHIKQTRGENVTEVLLKGDKGAVKTQDGWKSFAELDAAAAPAAADGTFDIAAGGGGGRGRGGQGAARALRLIKPAAVQATDLIGKTKEVTKADDAYTAELTDEAAKELLTLPAGGGRRGGGGGGGGGGAAAGGGAAPAPPADAKGTVKFWLKDGNLAKYELKLTGTMKFGENEFKIDRTTTVEVKDIGTTKIDVPDEAKAKASA